ncbi:hypothetical protein FNV43_RR01725 [Rhamnella rubrinervis]|uniref:Uncharacterized protein n=1 Tax=Rhamnella rubrinervis TaxID=2594499 RepID=A0A8K0HS04_9ROSA|nr:hypothetical protein FNV43_RR01725 [Rhamnella rubrinervis]
MKDNTSCFPLLMRLVNYKLSSGTSFSSRTSLSSLRDSLPETPHIYDFNKIYSATNNFLAKRYASSSSSTPSWRCTLRGKDERMRDERGRGATTFVRDEVRLCQKAAVKVRMVTGDNLQTAKAIALECGILGSDAEATEPNLIEGEAFHALSDTEREQIAEKI